MAEAAGVALQLHLAPSQADLCMITDNKGLFLVIDGWLQGLKQPEGWEVAERKRIRQGARCFMEASKARLRARTGRTSIRFVPSHTNGKSAEERLLDEADRLANQARLLPDYPAPYKFHEESMVFFSWQDNGRKNFILGDIRKVMKARVNAAKWDLWAAHPIQGRVVRGPVRAGDTKIMETALKRIRSMRKDYLLKFVSLVMTDLLPSDAMRPWDPKWAGEAKTSPEAPEDPILRCRICNADGDTPAHFWQCRA